MLLLTVTLSLAAREKRPAVAVVVDPATRQALAADVADYAATKRMQRTAKRIEEQMQTILDKTAAAGDDGPSEREFAIRSLRNYPLHWRTDDLLKMVSDPTENEDLRIIMAEALGWFCYSIERDKIAACLTDCLHHQHLSPRLRREMTKAVKRIRGE